MSVSSHLTPEPERRLWLLLEALRLDVRWTEAKLWGLSALAATELALLASSPAAGSFSRLGAGLLGAALLAGLAALSPVVETVRRLPWLEPPAGKPSVDDSLIDAEDLAKYAHGDLIHRLDKYLGGGVTAAPYHEDIVGEILLGARLSVRRRRLLGLVCLLAAAGQLGLLVRLASPYAR